MTDLTFAELRALAAATLAETHEKGWPYDGGGPEVWSECVDGLLGGAAGAYCAAVHPEMLTRLLDEMDALRNAYVTLDRDTQEAFRVIHAKQQRDAETIARLRAGEAA